MDASSKFQDSLPVSSDAVLAMLAERGVRYRLHEHVPLRTVEDAKSVEDAFIQDGERALRLKNLYLRDKKKRNYLISLEQDRDIDLKSLGAELGLGNLSFGSSDRLLQNLGVRPGAVTPLAMINGRGADVTFFMDKALHEADVVYMHPLVNDRTVAISCAEFLDFMEWLKVEITWI
ncbi:prolyl-tRNA synthetase associated domain-containing protein [Phaeobacter sp.]|uniref:prolyl-tRNA synthetase associated domain-containing protein n=1 Tax=Phaeobacter sp. TaxID=1902409 RepID=UPI0025F826EF|nr:prolyl-tRNA synthetase associated domain-containing protein [Phaeobacter sp.]